MKLRRRRAKAWPGAHPGGSRGRQFPVAVGKNHRAGQEHRRQPADFPEVPGATVPTLP